MAANEIRWRLPKFVFLFFLEKITLRVKKHFCSKSAMGGQEKQVIMRKIKLTASDESRAQPGLEGSRAWSHAIGVMNLGGWKWPQLVANGCKNRNEKENLEKHFPERNGGHSCWRDCPALVQKMPRACLFHAIVRTIVHRLPRACPTPKLEIKKKANYPPALPSFCHALFRWPCSASR